MLNYSQGDETVKSVCSDTKSPEHGAGLHLEGLNLSLTCTGMVHLLPHTCLLPGSEVHNLQNGTNMGGRYCHGNFWIINMYI